MIHGKSLMEAAGIQRRLRNRSALPFSSRESHFYSLLAYSNHVSSAQSKVGILLEACSPVDANEVFTECLEKNSYNEAKCRSQVNALYECCNAFYARNGEKASTVSCPKASLLRLKMSQRAEEMSK